MQDFYQLKTVFFVFILPSEKGFTTKWLKYQEGKRARGKFKHSQIKRLNAEIWGKNKSGKYYLCLL